MSANETAERLRTQQCLRNSKGNGTRLRKLTSKPSPMLTDAQPQVVKCELKLLVADQQGVEAYLYGDDEAEDEEEQDTTRKSAPFTVCSLSQASRKVLQKDSRSTILQHGILNIDSALTYTTNRPVATDSVGILD